ncbi:unnamed protein product [Amoebophrya sp. A25]|nr:unnamed protein product [Amoebophrya sp. A25]|eukprot:GSA25T00024893001.1
MVTQPEDMQIASDFLGGEPEVDERERRILDSPSSSSSKTTRQAAVVVNKKNGSHEEALTTKKEAEVRVPEHQEREHSPSVGETRSGPSPRKKEEIEDEDRTAVEAAALVSEEALLKTPIVNKTWTQTTQHTSPAHMATSNTGSRGDVFSGIPENKPATSKHRGLREGSPLSRKRLPVEASPTGSPQQASPQSSPIDEGKEKVREVVEVRFQRPLDEKEKQHEDAGAGPEEEINEERQDRFRSGEKELALAATSEGKDEGSAVENDQRELSASKSSVQGKESRPEEVEQQQADLVPRAEEELASPILIPRVDSVPDKLPSGTGDRGAEHFMEEHDSLPRDNVSPGTTPTEPENANCASSRSKIADPAGAKGEDDIKNVAAVEPQKNRSSLEQENSTHAQDKDELQTAPQQADSTSINRVDEENTSNYNSCDTRIPTTTKSASVPPDTKVRSVHQKESERATTTSTNVHEQEPVLDQEDGSFMFAHPEGEEELSLNNEPPTKASGSATSEKKEQRRRKSSESFDVELRFRGGGVNVEEIAEQLLKPFSEISEKISLRTPHDVQVSSLVILSCSSAAAREKVLAIYSKACSSSCEQRQKVSVFLRVLPETASSLTDAMGVMEHEGKLHEGTLDVKMRGTFVKDSEGGAVFEECATGSEEFDFRGWRLQTEVPEKKGYLLAKSYDFFVTPQRSGRRFNGGAGAPHNNRWRGRRPKPRSYTYTMQQDIQVTVTNGVRRRSVRRERKPHTLSLSESLFGKDASDSPQGDDDHNKASGNSFLIEAAVENNRSALCLSDAITTKKNSQGGGSLVVPQVEQLNASINKSPQQNLQKNKPRSNLQNPGPRGGGTSRLVNSTTTTNTINVGNYYAHNSRNHITNNIQQPRDFHHRFNANNGSGNHSRHKMQAHLTYTNRGGPGDRRACVPPPPHDMTQTGPISSSNAGTKLQQSQMNQSSSRMMYNRNNSFHNGGGGQTNYKGFVRGRGGDHDHATRNFGRGDSSSSHDHHHQTQSRVFQWARGPAAVTVVQGEPRRPAPRSQNRFNDAVPPLVNRTREIQQGTAARINHPNRHATNHQNANHGASSSRNMINRGPPENGTPCGGGLQSPNQIPLVNRGTGVQRALFQQGIDGRSASGGSGGRLFRLPRATPLQQDMAFLFR